MRIGNLGILGSFISITLISFKIYLFLALTSAGQGLEEGAGGNLRVTDSGRGSTTPGTEERGEISSKNLQSLGLGGIWISYRHLSIGTYP